MQIDNNYILTLERLGINEEVIELSKFIYENINKQSMNLPNNSFNIKKVIIVNYNKKTSTTKCSFDFGKSTKNTIYLNVNTNYEITEGIIYHELNHVLQFSKIGRDKTIKSSVRNLSYMYNNTTDSIILNNLIRFIYLTDKTEIDSFVYNLYYELKSYKENHNDENINDWFETQMKKSNIYRSYLFVKHFNIYRLKQLDQNIMKLFILNIDKNTKILKKDNYIIRKFFYKFKDFLYSNNTNYINIDKYYKEIETRKYKMSEYFFNKMTKLYDLL